MTISTMSTKHTPGPALIRMARMDCAAVAEGPFTPLVFQRYKFIGGERGYLLGYPIETSNGQGCIVWTHRASIAKATVGASHG